VVKPKLTIIMLSTLGNCDREEVEYVLDFMEEGATDKTIIPKLMP
jgi:hypothetical protein